MVMLAGRDDISAFDTNSFGGFGGGNISTISHLCAANGDADTLNVAINNFSNNTLVQVVIYEQVNGAGPFNALRAIEVPVGAGASPQSVAISPALSLTANNRYMALFAGDLSSLDGAGAGENVQLWTDPLIVAPDGSGSHSAEYPTYPDPLGTVNREIDGEYYWNLDGVITDPVITGIDGTVAPGQQITGNTLNLGTISSATLGGESLTIDATAADSFTVTIPSDIALAWGASHDLVVGDGTDTATLSAQTLSARTGWEYANLTEIPDTAESDGFFELASNDIPFTAVVGDQVQWETFSGLTVDNQWRVFLVPPTPPAFGNYVVFDVSAGTRYEAGLFIIQDESNPADTTPAAFEFLDVSGLDVSSAEQTNEVTVSGLDVPVTVSVSGLGAEYQINGGAWTSAPGTVSNGQTVRPRGTTSANISDVTTIAVTIGGTTELFSLITNAPADQTPDDFSFAAQTGAQLGTLYYSEIQTITGLRNSTPIRTIDLISQYRINSGDWTSEVGTINNGDSVQVRVLSSETELTETVAVLFIGGVLRNYSVTTLDAAAANEAVPISGELTLFPYGNDAAGNYYIYQNNISEVKLEGVTSDAGEVMTGLTVSAQIKSAYGSNVGSSIAMPHESAGTYAADIDPSAMILNNGYTLTITANNGATLVAEMDIPLLYKRRGL